MRGPPDKATAPESLHHPRGGLEFRGRSVAAAAAAAGAAVHDAGEHGAGPDNAAARRHVLRAGSADGGAGVGGAVPAGTRAQPQHDVVAVPVQPQSHQLSGVAAERDAVARACRHAHHHPAGAGAATDAALAAAAAAATHHHHGAAHRRRTLAHFPFNADRPHLDLLCADRPDHCLHDVHATTNEQGREGAAEK